MNIAILLAGGSGLRFGGEKVCAELQGKPVYSYSLDVFSQHPDIDHIILVVSNKNKPQFECIQKDYPKVSTLVVGGDSRLESSRNGFFEAKKQGAKVVLFHNLANPGVSIREISDVLCGVKDFGASGVGRKVTSTLRKKTGGVVSRQELFAMETPQGVAVDIFEKGLKNISGDATDDLSVAEAAGIVPEVMPVSMKNYKITTTEDLQKMKILFRQHMMFRSGIGQDSHRFSEAGTLVLGGIEVPGTPKLMGNSDADAVLHALTNAISSAIGGGSLSLFSDAMCKGGITDSAQYLEKILQDLKEQHGSLVNISIAIEAGKPKLESHFPLMKKRISEICGIEEDSVGITVTSGEKLTEVGQGKGISVIAIVHISFPGT